MDWSFPCAAPSLAVAVAVAAFLFVEDTVQNSFLSPLLVEKVVDRMSPQLACAREWIVSCFVSAACNPSFSKFLALFKSVFQREEGRNLSTINAVPARNVPDPVCSVSVVGLEYCEKMPPIQLQKMSFKVCFSRGRLIVACNAGTVVMMGTLQRVHGFGDCTKPGRSDASMRSLLRPISRFSTGRWSGPNSKLQMEIDDSSGDVERGYISPIDTTRELTTHTLMDASSNTLVY